MNGVTSLREVKEEISAMLRTRPPQVSTPPAFKPPGTHGERGLTAEAGFLGAPFCRLWLQVPCQEGSRRDV